VLGAAGSWADLASGCRSAIASADAFGFGGLAATSFNAGCFGLAGFGRSFSVVERRSSESAPGRAGIAAAMSIRGTAASGVAGAGAGDGEDLSLVDSDGGDTAGSETAFVACSGSRGGGRVSSIEEFAGAITTATGSGLAADAFSGGSIVIG
jgi:hypothetical protein